MKRLFILAPFIFLVCASAQDSLGDAARQVRSDKAAQPHAKIVVDDEVAPLKSRSPFPEIALKGLDNTNDICRSIEDYRKAHTRAELENALRDWYADYDQMVRLFLKEQALAQERQSDQFNRPTPSYSSDYKKYWEAMQARQRADELDRRRMYADQATVNRVQQGLQRVQTFLNGRGLTYSWFKIRRSYNDLDL